MKKEVLPVKEETMEISDYSVRETFAQLMVPPDVPFFIRLDGRRFHAVSEKVNVEKPFDERFARCLVLAARALFHGGFNPALIYVASDEINALFLDAAPFRRRVEKIDSVFASILSSAFSLGLLKFYGKTVVVAFDSRVIIFPPEKIVEYLDWRQKEAWRNHNNAYAYWLLRKEGYRPSEAASRLKGLKTKDIHDFLFRQGINLAQTPTWQRRGILIHRETYQKPVGNQTVIRRRITENWELPLFPSTEGRDLIQQILNWAKPATEDK